MKGTAKSVAIDGRTAREVTITARRDETGRARDDLPEDLRRRRDGVLSRVLRDTGIPADGWTVTTEPGEARIAAGAEVPTAALAAILRAHAGTGGAGAADEAVMLGAWRTADAGRGTVEIGGVRGDAIRLRWAAENGRPAAGPVWEFRGGVLPRNRTTRYHDIRTVEDLRAALTDGRRPEVEEPADGAEPAEIGREHEHLLADREGILRGLIGPIEEAVTARRPLLIRTDAETGGEPGVPGLAAARLANAICPGMTPDEQQHVLETYDLAGIAPPAGTPATPGADGRGRRPIPRPLRYPHPTATAGVLGSMDRAIFPSGWNGCRRPGEVDLAGHGVLVVEVDEEMHLERDAADAVRDDIEHRTGHRYTLLAVGRVEWMKKTGGYPLRDVFKLTADWTGQRGTVEIVDPARHREAGLKLIEDARRRVTGAWT